MKDDPTNTERQARFAAAMREKGFTKLCEWIPAEKREAFKALAREWRGEGASQTDAEAVERVRQARSWGWTPGAIASYTGRPIGEVKRILGEE
jgi:hypothetical protein